MTESTFSKVRVQIRNLGADLNKLLNRGDLPQDLKKGIRDLIVKTEEYDMEKLKVELGHTVKEAEGELMKADDLAAIILRFSGLKFRYYSTSLLGNARSNAELASQLPDPDVYCLTADPAKCRHISFTRSTKTSYEAWALRFTLMPGHVLLYEWRTHAMSGSIEPVPNELVLDRLATLFTSRLRS